MTARGAEGLAGRSAALVWAVNLAAAALVLLWTIPTLGLLVSSFRDRDQIITSGWWRAAFSATESRFVRAGTASDQIPEGDLFVISGNVLPPEAELKSWGVTSKAPGAYQPGETADL